MNLDPMYLHDKYAPLRRSIFNKYKNSVKDLEELNSNIDLSFMQLLSEYNPQRGVDFPYFIKKMLNLRVQHYVNRLYNNSNKINNNFLPEDFELGDDNKGELILDDLINLLSVNPDIKLGSKHRNLFKGVLLEHKTIRELAQEEGVPTDRVHARLYFLCRKFIAAHEGDNDEQD